MAGPRGQEKVGHLRSTSTNDVAKTGRKDGTTGGQKRVGHHRSRSPQGDVDRSSRGVPAYKNGEQYNTTKVRDRGIDPSRKDLVDNSPNIEGP